MSSEAAGHLLSRLLAAAPRKCPGCRRDIDTDCRGHCPRCGELLSLEVRSLRQVRWGERGSIPVILTIGVSTWGALRLAALAGLMWAGPLLLFTRGPGQQLPAEFRLTLAVTSGAAATALCITAFCWVKRKALLRSPLRARIMTMVAVLTGVAGCTVVAWISMTR